MAFRPAPPVGTRVGWEGHELLSGDVVLVPGVGVFGRTDAGKLLIDSVNARPPASLHHFHPGVLAAGDLATMTNPGVTGAAILTLLEANCGVAPDGNATDHLVLRVAGADDGELDLPLVPASQGQTHYTIDRVTPTAAVGIVHTGLPATIAGGVVNGTTARVGWATAFAPASDLRVRAVRFTNGSAAVPAGVRRVLSILDQQRQPIVEWPTYDGWGAGAVIVSPLPVAVDLDQGSRYMLAVRIDHPVAQPLGYRFKGYQNMSVSNDPFGYSSFPITWDDYLLSGDVFQPSVGTTQKLTGSLVGDINEPAHFVGRSWDELIDDATPTIQSTPRILTTNHALHFELLAEPQGVLLAGNIALSVVQEGSGGTPPQDVNVRMHLQGIDA